MKIRGPTARLAQVLDSQHADLGNVEYRGGERGDRSGEFGVGRCVPGTERLCPRRAASGNDEGGHRDNDKGSQHPCPWASRIGRVRAPSRKAPAPAVYTP